MKRRFALAIVVAPLIHAQVPPAFDVASVKPDPWGSKGSSYFVGIRLVGDTLTAEHSCLYGLVEFAYNLRDEQLSGGPSWARCAVLATSDHYQVIAKSTAAPMQQFRLMLQTLLADRFQLKIHHAPKDLPIYNLVVAPRGPKLKESATDAKFSMNQDARLNAGRAIRITATRVSMERLVPTFEHFAGRPLFDRTGLTGSYDLELAFDAGLTDAPGPDPVGQTFATALEKQLGLKLESSTAPFDTVVIDHAEKPSGN
jgi:uncharacterized protein (TIGR03435 family)